MAFDDLCRERAISNATFYKWRSMYGGMDAAVITELKGIRVVSRFFVPVAREKPQQKQ